MTDRERQRRLRRIRRRRLRITLLLLFLVAVACGVFLLCSLLLQFRKTASDDPPSTTVTTAPTTVRAQSWAPATPAQEVPVILQNPELPTGCESTAAAMLLQAYGYDVSKTAFAQALPKSRLTTYNGRVYAAHPNRAFIGNPFSGSADFGVFAGVVADTMQSFIRQAGGDHLVKDITGADEAALLSLLDRKIPICVWATISMVPVRENSGGWYLMDGDVYTEKWFSWPGNEHCLVLVGYDADTVTVRDPLRGAWQYDRTTFFTRYAELGKQAIILEACA